MHATSDWAAVDLIAMSSSAGEVSGEQKMVKATCSCFSLREKMETAEALE